MKQLRFKWGRLHFRVFAAVRGTLGIVQVASSWYVFGTQTGDRCVKYE